MAVVFWKIRVITKPGSVSLFSQKAGTVPALCQASKLSMPEWAVALETLVGGVWGQQPKNALRSALRFDVSAEQFCVGLWPVGAQSGSLNPLLLCLLSWTVWILLDLQTGAWGRTSGSFAYRSTSTWIQTREHKTLMCLFKLCMEEPSVKMVQHHCSHGMMTVLLILWIC